MAHVVKLTKDAIVKLVVGPKRYYVRDTEIACLQVCVGVSGRKSFEIVKKVDSATRRMSLGQFPDMNVDMARRKARELLGKLAAGQNVFDAKKEARQQFTLGELFAMYLTKRAKPHNITWKEEERIFEAHFAQWRKKSISKITKEDVISVHTAIGADHPYAANRAVEVLSSVYAFAEEIGEWKGLRPTHRVKRFKEDSRERFIQPDEMPRFMTSLEQEHKLQVRHCILLLLLLGARVGNTVAMRWDQVSLERGEWRIPKTKNGKSQLVYLPPAAINVLREQQELAKGSEWVFPGRGKSGHMHSPKKPFRVICDRAKITDLRIHDLRRTLGSWQAATGASIPVIGKTLGHENQRSTQVYARLNLDPVRLAVNKAVSAMLGTSTPKPAVANDDDDSYGGIG